jgi:uncharacterized protein (DUF433 family)
MKMVTWQERIVVEPKVMVGKPVVKGTRLTVEFIIDLLANGWSEAEIIRNYLGLTVQDIRACLAFASQLLQEDKEYPLGI